MPNASQNSQSKQNKLQITSNYSYQKQQNFYFCFIINSFNFFLCFDRNVQSSLFSEHFLFLLINHKRKESISLVYSLDPFGICAPQAITIQFGCRFGVFSFYDTSAYDSNVCTFIFHHVFWRVILLAQII